MLFKLIVIILLLFIIGSLFSGLYFMMNDKSQSERTVKALTIRIAISVGLFLLLFIGMATGLIQPHGIHPG